MLLSGENFVGRDGRRKFVKERRNSKRREDLREGEDRRRPVRVRSRPGERNILKHGSGEELLSELDGLDELELTVEPEGDDGFNPYDSADK